MTARRVWFLTTSCSYVAFLAWAIAVNVSFIPLINYQANKSSNPNPPSASVSRSFISAFLYTTDAAAASALKLIQSLVTAMMICAAILLIEKLAIQMIAQSS